MLDLEFVPNSAKPMYGCFLDRTVWNMIKSDVVLSSNGLILKDAVLVDDEIRLSQNGAWYTTDN